MQFKLTLWSVQASSAKGPVYVPYCSMSSQTVVYFAGRATLTIVVTRMLSDGPPANLSCFTQRVQQVTNLPSSSGR